MMAAAEMLACIASSASTTATSAAQMRQAAEKETRAGELLF